MPEVKWWESISNVFVTDDLLDEFFNGRGLTVRAVVRVGEGESSFVISEKLRSVLDKQGVDYGVVVNFHEGNERITIFLHDNEQSLLFKLTWCG